MNVDIFRAVRDAIAAAAPDTARGPSLHPHREEILMAVVEILGRDGYGDSPDSLTAWLRHYDAEIAPEDAR